MGDKLWGEAIDSVVMLTWSDWKTEPRSNRYHFATRFARHVPVFFVQPDSVAGKVWLEHAAPNLTIVHAPSTYGIGEAQELASTLYRAGCRRPMLWTYNFMFEAYIHRSNAVIRAMHATENYLIAGERLAVADEDMRASLKRVLQHTDLLVAVSAGVLDGCVVKGGYTGATLLLENGCDSKFWYNVRAFEHTPAVDGRPVALFQGGINNRLDLPLLANVARRLPEWHFWFCGKVQARLAGWDEVASLPNVRCFGFQDVDRVAELARQATVGLIPFHQDELIRRSLPLKAYEYVACGMPVVSVPIDALAGRSDLFRFATTAEEFALALEEVRSSRSDATAVARRLAAAAAESYDNRFHRLTETLRHRVERVRSQKAAVQRYNIFLVYDDASTHIGTVAEHIEALQRYTRHNVVLAPATRHVPYVDDVKEVVDLSAFDAVVVHYSVRVSLDQYISSGMAAAIAAYDGPKLLYIQDEYESTETARRWIERLDIDTVFTCVPLDQLDKVYPRSRFPKIEFVGTLTGYVPEDASIEEYAKPLADRSTMIGYRGRRLPHQYGLLGQEKLRIGIEVRDRALKLGLPVDIEVDDSQRIYGKDWYRFLGSCRATLGTESGANVFDDHGELKRLATQHSAMPFAEFALRYLGPYEGKVHMNQVSPKIFEAIRMRTALILFEGSYSGVVEPNVHYIPLKKDFSNFEEVVEKISSIEYLETLTERAYRDIVESGRWSYRAFGQDFSRYLSRRLLERPARARVVSAPVLAFFGNQSPASVWPSALMHALANDQILDHRITRQAVFSAMNIQKSPDVDLRTVARLLRREILESVRAAALKVPGLRQLVRALKRLRRETLETLRAGALKVPGLRRLVRALKRLRRETLESLRAGALKVPGLPRLVRAVKRRLRLYS
ncbi:glycosyltransferase [Bradyrhizobium sp. USDA 4452]